MSETRRTYSQEEPKHGQARHNGRQPIPNAFAMDLALRHRYTSSERGLSLEPYLLLRNFLDGRYAHVEGYPMPGFNVLAGIEIRI